MLKFAEIAQTYPDLRDAELRRKDFQEIYASYSRAKAEEQASRCSQCGIPFCQVHCPLQNNIPDWLLLTAKGRLREAYEVSSATNTFPEICGRICPQDRLCEGNCVVNKDFNAITIGSIEKFLTDNAFAEGWVQPFTPESENGTSVGIIGAGPAGLAAAERLRRAGCAVTVYDRYDRMGGLMIYGIPNFKLDKQILLRRREWMEQSGVVFEFGVSVGETHTLHDLKSRHDAMLIATGVYRARDLKIPGCGLPGIIPAMTFLTASNRKGLGDAVPEFDSGELNAEGKHVVVIGGGDTAMDCVRTSIRQGAASVTCLYRRDKGNMPGSAREVYYAEQEGVTFTWLSSPKAFLGKNSVEGILVQPMRLGPVDASGRQQPEPVPDGEYRLRADLVITALGFDAEDLPTLFNEPALTVSEWGTVKADATGMTSLPGIFAAGDIVRGASLVVWAIRDGREAADGILRHLAGAKVRKAA